MAQTIYWDKWTDEDWNNSVYCETCGLPMLPTPPNENGIGGYQCSYCALTAQVETLTKALEEICAHDPTAQRSTWTEDYMKVKMIARHSLGKDVS